ncbi:MAG: hypothetical protein KDA45_11645, partial [Planctomycetales bacterium]|nr:hypothetical protein [Planctomycetales bacterium]
MLCLLTVSGWHSQGQAAPPHGWEVLRVFIWDEPDQLNRLVTRQYTPVLIEELERQLAEENELRKESLLESPMLDEALYVARLDGEFLVSEQSRWKLSGKSASQPFSLGNVSISLRPARVAAEEPQLLDHVQFSPNGALELLLPGGKLKRWFGFSLHSAQRAQQRSFRLRLPAAASGKMLISAPASVELSSRQVVVEKVETPTSLLPGDWTVGSLPSAGTASQWWHVNISGVSNFELTMQRPAAANTTWYKHLVRESTVDYQAGEKMLFAHARFVVAGGQRPSLPLRLRTGSQLRLQEVLVGGQRVQWQVQSSLAGDSHLIELPSVDTAQQELVIELSAACPIETDQSVTLPEIAV